MNIMGTNENQEQPRFIIKRDGARQDFNVDKIRRAIRSAFAAVDGGEFDAIEREATSAGLAYVVAMQFKNRDEVSVEDVQDAVEKALMKAGQTDVAKAYILYRQKHAEAREMRSGFISKAESIFVETDKLNANITNSPAGKMLQLGGLAAKTYAREKGFPREFMDAHDGGDIHIHDLDFSLLTVNCLQIPAKKLLQNGFGFCRPATHIESAAALVAILIQANQNDMFGGQNIPSFDSVLAPYAGTDVADERISASMQGLIYNLNMMHSRAGAQVPFSSLNVGLDTSAGGRRITKLFLEEYDKGLGKGENPLFPNVIFKVKSGVNRFPGDPNYDLFKLAIRVAAHRMNPTFAFMDSSFNAPLGNVEIMGCRTRVGSNVNGEAGSEARGNLFFTTLNLPRLGILANGDVDRFYKLLDEKMQLCERQLMHRWNIVRKFRVKDLPFCMGEHLYMGSEGLKPEDTIEEAIKNGTIAMGFIGLAETLVALTGKHHGESEESLKLGLEIVGYMKKFMDGLTKKYHLNFSLFATPAEGLSGRFTKIDRERFGEIKGVTDREYYTNSFHVPVYFPISHFKKIAIEGKFHSLCLGGHISYVEFEAPPMHNLVAVEKELNHMADSDIGYAGINFPIDYCKECGYQAVIDGDECPICGSHSVRHIRRITGYLSDIENFNAGKRAEERDRTKS